MFLLFILLFLSSSLYAQSFDLDTISIKGHIAFDESQINGNFLYTIKNNNNKRISQWLLIIHPSVSILSVNQNGKEARFKEHLRSNYRILSIQLPEALDPNNRESIGIKFTIPAQNHDTRFTVSSNYVFLDARKLWFPYPVKDHKAEFAISTSVPETFYASIGAAIVSETNFSKKRITLWSNELDSISPSLSLIISQQKRTGIKPFYIYSNDKKEQNISTFILPFWKILKEKHKYFPFSEIHIHPINFNIPEQESGFADGEFIGNIILLDKNLVNAALDTPDKNFYLAGNTQKRLIETIIHELYHSYFPGILKLNKSNYMLTEILTQYFTWGLIQEHSPSWALEISHRNRFILQNLLLLKKNHQPLWEYLFGTSILSVALGNSSLKSFELSDTIIEKYRYTDFSYQDLLDTIDQYFVQNSNEIIYTKLLKNIDKKELFNTKIELKQDYEYIITNKSKFKKRKSKPFLQTNTVITITHNYPDPWVGQLTLIGQKSTNTYSIKIPNGENWSTNITEFIDSGYIESHLDFLDEDLSDNSFNIKNIGTDITDFLNNQETKTNIHISEEIFENIKLLQNDYNFLMDYSFNNENNILLSLFLLQNKEKKGLILLDIKKKDHEYIINSIINTKE